MNQPNIMWGFVDSDWAGCPDSLLSTTGHGFTPTLNAAAVVWKYKRQSVVALSSQAAEAEFIAASAFAHEVIYTRRLLENLGFPSKEPTFIYEDNRTCIAWSELRRIRGWVLNILTLESILCMTLWRLRFSN
jgi:hypothetical protein